MESASFLGHYAEMPDLMRWRYIRRIFELNQPPPQDTFLALPQACQLHLSRRLPWTSVEMQGDEIVSVRRWAICASTF
jgi:FAD-dependent urate hydroxylase